MREKDLENLEFMKILDRLAAQTSFSAGRELAFELRPSSDAFEVEAWQRETAEARALQDTQPSIGLGGVHDVRPFVSNARKGMVLTPEELLNVRDTLVKGRTLRRGIGRMSSQYPTLSALALLIEECAHVAAEISRCINERAEVMDSASPALARLRQDLRQAHERLMDRLHHIVSAGDNAGFLQENIITQRHGRYVIPLKADFKGRIPGLIHDESTSGATLFIEPLATVELNNALRELQLEEQREVTRILSNLASLVADEGDFIGRTVEVLARLDLAFAKANYAAEIRAVSPQFVAWTRPARVSKQSEEIDGSEHENAAVHPGSTIRYLKARHPLLSPEDVVPINVHLSAEDRYFVIVITGPNTGGKTVALKTVGLLTCMAQAGMQIPVEEESVLSVFDGVFADIGDEQSIEQSLSTFSSHMVNLIDILGHAQGHSMVLLDELGAGTDPIEGSALARSLLSHMLRRGVTTLATTHYSELKVYAQATPGVVNASVEFDIETLSPTYELSIGLPGRSNAFAIANRLGLPASIIADAQALVSPDTLQTEGLLADLKEVHRQAQSDRAVARELREKLETQTAELRERLLGAEAEQRELLEAARQQAEEELQSVRREVSRARDLLRRLPDQATEVNEAVEAIRKLEERITRMEPAPSSQPIPLEHVAVGDQVWVSTLSSKGEVVGVTDRGVEVQVGQFRVQADRKALRRLSGKQEPAPVEESRSTRVVTSRHITPTFELDLRGWRVEEALIQLERYLDDAYLGGLPWVRIIHGKGTGALRRAVRDTLAMHPLVSSFKSGELNEGGDGVTFAELAQKN